MFLHLYQSLVIFTRSNIRNTSHKTLDVRHINTETSSCERLWRTKRTLFNFYIIFWVFLRTWCSHCLCNTSVAIDARWTTKSWPIDECLQDVCPTTKDAERICERYIFLNARRIVGVNGQAREYGMCMCNM